MNPTNTKNNNNNTISAVLILFGVASALVSLISIDYSILVDSSDSMYAILDVLYIAACCVTAYAVYSDNRDFMVAGSFIGASVQLLKAYKIFKWIKSSYDYFESLDGCGTRILYLLVALCGAAGFIMLGLFYTKSYAQQLKDKILIIVIMLAVCGAGETIYPFFSFKSYNDAGEFFGNFLAGKIAIVSPFFMILGLILFLITEYPDAFSNASSSVNNTTAASAATTVYQQSAAEQAKGSSEPEVMSFENRMEMIRKYKNLLDMDIITQEEFEKKKKELLG